MYWTCHQSKHISKDANDMKFSPDVNISSSIPHMQNNQTIDVHKLVNNEKWQSIEHMKNGRRKNTWKVVTPAELYQ